MATDNEELQRALDACLDRVLQEGTSIEACLRTYPEHAEALEPLLRMAADTRQTLEFTPSTAAKAVARAALHDAIGRRREQPRWWSPWRMLRGLSVRMGGSYKWAISAAAAGLVMVLGSSGIVVASSGSMPDQPLYPVKRAVEQVRLVVTFDDQAKARLHAAYADRRMAEMAAMATKGKPTRLQPLRNDMEHHLGQIKSRALPGVSIPVFDLTSVPPADKSFIDEPRMRPTMMPATVNKLRLRTLSVLQKTLEQDLQRQEQRLRRALRVAPEPARAELRKEYSLVRDRYRALILTVQQLTEEESEPVKDTRPQSRDRQ